MADVQRKEEYPHEKSSRYQRLIRFRQMLPDRGNPGIVGFGRTMLPSGHCRTDRADRLSVFSMDGSDIDYAAIYGRMDAESGAFRCDLQRIADRPQTN